MEDEDEARKAGSWGASDLAGCETVLSPSSVPFAPRPIALALALALLLLSLHVLNP